MVAYVQFDYFQCTLSFIIFSFSIDGIILSSSGNSFFNLMIVWINCKKEGGDASCYTPALIDAMNEYKDYLVKQIRNVDADLIICCGYSESAGCPILDFLKANVYDLEYAGEAYEDVWYDKTANKLAIASWHPSARVSHEAFYHYIVETYQRFIHDHPSFVESHRVEE